MSNAALMQDFCLLNCSMEQGCLHDECGTVDGANHVVECFSTNSHGTSFEKLAFQEADKKEWLTWIKNHSFGADCPPFAGPGYSLKHRGASCAFCWVGK